MVSIDAGLVYESNLDPEAAAVPVDGDTDMRRPRQLRPGIDATWTGLGRPPLRLRWPEPDLEATLETEASHIVATNALQRSAVAVEPQTHAPQGLRRLIKGEAGAMSVLQPAERMELSFGLVFREGSAPAP